MINWLIEVSLRNRFLAIAFFPKRNFSRFTRGLSERGWVRSPRRSQRHVNHFAQRYKSNGRPMKWQSQRRGSAPYQSPC
jgi:hypothetical protein